MEQKLSRLENVKARDVWHDESLDFTPWLLENADVLAEVLGIDLELTSREHAVGAFSLDLYGRDITNNCVLIVENQLAQTDHSHLGQLLTYAAGTEARTIVWTATSFREEHRRALDWLNDVVGEETRFFGIEIGAVKIADSPPAPLLKLKAQPNEWGKQVMLEAKTADELSPRSIQYRQFWTEFLERAKIERPNWFKAARPTHQSWVSMSAPFKGGPYYVVGFATEGRLRTELYVDGPTAAASNQLFEFLKERKVQIEQEFGGALSWEDLPNRRACHIAAYRRGDVAKVEEYDEYINWFFDAGDRLRKAMTTPAEAWLAFAQEHTGAANEFDTEG